MSSGARALAAPAALAVPMVWLAFESGGFFADTTAIAAVACGLGLLVWTTVARRPFAAVSAPLVVASGALAALAAWTLLSGLWSGSAGRAVVEFDRALLYALVVLLFGLAFRDPADRRRLVRGLAAAGVVVCGAAVTTRLLPEVWSATAAVQADRLSHPLTYWNALGLIGTLTFLALAHLTCCQREPAALRVLSAAAIPVVAVCTYFTFSRAAIGLAPVGLVVYLALARPRGALGGLLAALPAAAVALVAAYGADILSTERAATPEGVEQGGDVAAVLGLCVLGAAVVRLAALRLDARLVALRLTPRARRRIVVGVAAVALLAVAVPAAVADGPGWVRTQIEGFTDADYVSSEGDRRERLVQIGNNGRLDHWEAALDAFREEPLHGTGAGTYAIAWMRERPNGFNVQDGHSLYVEVLGELGVVGLALVLLALGALAAGAVRLLRRGERGPAAAAVAVLTVWAVHAGLDWHWEMPAVTLPALALAGAMLGSRADAPARVAAPPQTARVVLGLACLLLVVTPALVALSQRHLDAAVAAFRSGDCRRGIDRALASSRLLRARAEPFEVLGYCDARLGRSELAIRAFEAALDRDPDNWELHYGAAIVRAAGGRDPRPALRTAARLNPRSELVRTASEAFATDDPRTWRRRATRARLPL